MLICHLMCCHPSDRLLICCPSMTDLSHAAILLTDFSCCYFQQTLGVATSDRLWMLSLPTDFGCRHSQRTLDVVTLGGLYLLSRPTDFTCCHFRQTFDAVTPDGLYYLPAPSLAQLPALSYHALAHYGHTRIHSCGLDNIIRINVRDQTD